MSLFLWWSYILPFFYVLPLTFKIQFFLFEPTQMGCSCFICPLDGSNTEHTGAITLSCCCTIMWWLLYCHCISKVDNVVRRPQTAVPQQTRTRAWFQTQALSSSLFLKKNFTCWLTSPSHRAMGAAPNIPFYINIRAKWKYLAGP